MKLTGVRHVKWCLIKNYEFGAELAVPESVKEHILDRTMPQGNVPLGSKQFCCKEMCTNESRCCVEKRLGGSPLVEARKELINLCFLMTLSFIFLFQHSLVLN